MTDVERALKHQLQQAKSLCLTIDLWSSHQMRRYLGITGYYILNCILQSVLLSCCRFHERHTFENINQQVEEMLPCFDVARKVTNVTRDNTSNMKKAFILPGFDESSDDSTGSQNTIDEEHDYMTITGDISEFTQCEHKPGFTHNAVSGQGWFVQIRATF